jgi:hypothetical protein
VKRNIVLIQFLAAVLFLCSACTQEPLFYYIYMEIEPIKPVIGGAASRFVRDTAGNIYTANGDLWKFDLSAKRWSQPPTPGGKIKSVATTTSKLFIINYDGSLYRDNGAGGWDSFNISGIQQIYGSGGVLFAGNGDSVFFMSEGAAAGSGMTGLGGAGGLLLGAVESSGSHYLVTKNGLYSTPSTPGAVTLLRGGDFLGIIVHNNVVTAVDGNAIYYLSSGSVVELSRGPSFTGALASWDDGVNKILLAGLIRGSGTYSYGYREFIWDGTTPPPVASFTPGDNGQYSSDPDSRYSSTIGKYAVYGLIATPPSFVYNTNGKPVVFAASTKDGVFSYRSRGGSSPQWNGENNDY